MLDVYSRRKAARLLGCSDAPCTAARCSAAQLLGCSAALLHDCSAALLLGCSAHEYSAAQLMAARLHDRAPATRHSKKVSGVLGKGQYACWDREVVDLTIILKGGATGGETMCVSWGRTFKRSRSQVWWRAYRGAYLRRQAGWSEYVIGALIGWGVWGVSRLQFPMIRTRRSGLEAPAGGGGGGESERAGALPGDILPTLVETPVTYQGMQPARMGIRRSRR